MGSRTVRSVLSAHFAVAVCWLLMASLGLAGVRTSVVYVALGAGELLAILAIDRWSPDEGDDASPWRVLPRPAGCFGWPPRATLAVWTALMGLSLVLTTACFVLP